MKRGNLKRNKKEEKGVSKECRTRMRRSKSGGGVKEKIWTHEGGSKRSWTGKGDVCAKLFHLSSSGGKEGWGKEKNTDKSCHICLASGPYLGRVFSFRKRKSLPRGNV